VARIVYSTSYITVTC